MTRHEVEAYVAAVLTWEPVQRHLARGSVVLAQEAVLHELVSHMPAFLERVRQQEVALALANHMVESANRIIDGQARMIAGMLE